MPEYPFTPLKRCTSAAVPRVIAFDTEDNGLGAPHGFLCASFYDGKQAWEFTSREDARKFMFTRRNAPVFFIAHNLGYDMSSLDYPEGTIHRMPLKSRLIGGVWKDAGNHKHRWLDTGNFFVGASIDKIGKHMGFEKIGCEHDDTDFDDGGMCVKCRMFTVRSTHGKKLHQLNDRTIANMQRYCTRDSMICHKAAMVLVNLSMKHQTRFNAFTAPSLAMKIFRTNYHTSNWEKRPMDINDFERLAYYGGRTEVFDYNEHPHVFYDDIRSSYPAAMYFKEFPHPNSVNHVQQQSWDEIRNLEGASLVTVDVPDMRIPPLPYRSETGKLLFPHGRWTAAYTHPELRMAEKYGARILEVHDSLIYSRMFNPFRGYIEYFYKAKDTTTGIEREFNKLMLNGLSGKFGEKREMVLRGMKEDVLDGMCRCNGEKVNLRSNTCMKCLRPKLEGSLITEFDNGWSIARCGRQKDPKHAFPILIAYITSYGRIKLYEERLRYGKALYSDTDSHIAEDDITDNIGSALGQWDRKEFSDFQAYVPKFYICKSDEELNLKLKGVPKKHKLEYICEGCELRYAHPCICVCGNTVRDTDRLYTFMKPTKEGESVRRGLQPNTWNEMEKRVSFHDDKRERLNNGDSKPLGVHENKTDWSFKRFLNEKLSAVVSSTPASLLNTTNNNS